MCGGGASQELEQPQCPACGTEELVDGWFEPVAVYVRRFAGVLEEGAVE